MDDDSLIDEVFKLALQYRGASSADEKARLADEIITLMAPRLGTYVSLRIYESSDNEDVLQNILISISTSLDGFPGSTTDELRIWIFTIANRRVIDYIDKKQRKPLQTLPPEEIISRIDTLMRAEPVSEEALYKLEWALNLIRRSYPDCIKHLTDYYIVDLDYTEMAAEQEISYDAARMRFDRCLEKAQKLLAKYAGQQ